MGVHPEVVLGVVAVAAGAFEDGGEVEGLHPQVLEVGQGLQDAKEVPSVELPGAVGPRGLVPGLLSDGLTPVKPGPVLGGQVLWPLAEAVGKDLVKDRAQGPLRGKGFGEEVEEAVVAGKGLLQAVASPVAFRQAEEVAEGALGHGHLGLEPARDPGHGLLQDLPVLLVEEKPLLGLGLQEDLHLLSQAGEGGREVLEVVVGHGLSRRVCI